MTAPDVPLPMVATADIAQVVARELRTPSGKGKRVLHLRAPHLYTMREATAASARPSTSRDSPTCKPIRSKARPP